jgi:hypothetical protein
VFILFFWTVQSKYVNGLEVTGSAQKERVGRERKRIDGGVSFETASKFKQTFALRYRENPNDRALFGRRGQLRAVPVERQGSQRTVMSRNHGDRSLCDFKAAQQF